MRGILRVIIGMEQFCEIRSIIDSGVVILNGNILLAYLLC